VTDLVAARRPFVDGQWVGGEGGELAVASPATEQTIATVETASTSQVERAISAARRAFDEGPWPRLPAPERIAAVLRLADALEARRDLLIETVIGEAGCSRGVTEIAQVGMALHSIRELTDLYGRMPGWEHNEVPLADHLVGSTVRLSIRRYEPTGVVAAITPYNFPFITNVWKVVPALLAGCTTVLRPSPLTPLEATVLGEAAEEAIADAGPEHFGGKVVIDAMNPLDFSRGFPPRLSITGEDSLGERVQRALPEAKVVKAFNTIGNPYFVDPSFSDGQPTMLIAGDDEDAKRTVRDVLSEFGWSDTVDIGGIEGSRELEAICIAWVKIGGARGAWDHGFKLLAG
jgi:acyl-CoA reductase-like NAD-dependent aldehyde dehydrogenase